ncbi:DNA alkylation repair protein [Arthrobacter sp. FW306-06-A]|uniref:DNA alkylation repair protein n=1 Tax=Arthrobacter sp. FW306-06-A TaxID=2879621 RepID=UPI001F16605B|nr:DNA alkylation repair protein [Arthrobacter sp. FW306-06-A]UKA69396.1 DNA alkylation repair protein [Arthrobacter sp. FW306-06-A]
MTGPADVVSAAAEFVDRTLQNEGAWYRADDVGNRLGWVLDSYGSSIGAVRGTVRDALRKFKDLDHDTTVMLASTLWGQPRPGSRPVFERRLAAVVLLQSRVRLLRHSDLTRLEGFLRSAQAADLIQPLLGDVLVPLLSGLGERERQRANAVLARWRDDPDPQLQAAAAALEKDLIL